MYVVYTQMCHVCRVYPEVLCMYSIPGSVIYVGYTRKCSVRYSRKRSVCEPGSGGFVVSILSYARMCSMQSGMIWQGIKPCPERPQCGSEGY